MSTILAYYMLVCDKAQLVNMPFMVLFPNILKEISITKTFYQDVKMKNSGKTSLYKQTEPEVVRYAFFSLHCQYHSVHIIMAAIKVK